MRFFLPPAVQLTSSGIPEQRMMKTYSTVVLLMAIMVNAAMAGWQDDIQPKRSITLGKSNRIAALDCS